MNRRLKRPIALGAVGVLAVAGGGIAYAATSGSDPQTALLNDAAQRLNVSPDKLRSALAGAFSDRLDQAVKDGRLTRQQADRIEQQLKQHGGLPPLGGPGPGFHGPFGGPDGPGPLHVGFDAAAAYLGLTSAKLREQLMSGTSLADVAKARNKSLDGLEQALIDATKTELDKAVADGHLTAAQRDALLKRLQQHVGDLVQGKGPGPGGPGPGFRHRFRGPGGPGPDGFGGPPPPGAPGWH